MGYALIGVDLKNTVGNTPAAADVSVCVCVYTCMCARDGLRVYISVHVCMC